ncbi:MAG: sodium:solute symporter family transporter, partial [Bacteroidia bacterium]
YLFMEYQWEPLTQLETAKKTMSFNAHWWEIITWFLLATVVMSDPGYHQRIYSSKSPAVAKRGLLLSVLCWTFFDFLAAGVALYGLGLLPDLENSSLVYPVLASEILPLWLGAFFMIGLLATVMSTLDSFLFLSAQTLMIDLIGIKTETGKTMRLGLVLVSILTFFLLLPYWEKNVVEFFYDFTPFVVCVLVPPIVSVFIPAIRLNAQQVGAQMLFAILVCLLWKYSLSAEMNSELSAVVPGLGATLLFQLVLMPIKKRAKGIGN